MTETNLRGNESHRQRQQRLLAESDWTSLLFAMLVFSGGLFCAFYFFNGTELLRTVKGLPHELLYPRPSTEMQGTQNAKIDKFHRGSGQGGRLARSSAESSDRRTKPFGPNPGSPQLNPSSSLATPGASSGASSTSFSPPSNSSSGSNAPRSGSAALSSRTSTSTRAATNAAQAKVSNAKRTALQSPKRMRASLKPAKHGLPKTKANPARITQNVQHTSRVTGLARNDAARSGTTTNSGAGSLGRAGLGGLGHAGGAGGLGGLGGRLSGGASGGLSGGHH